ncbi:MAG: hypothetical protein WB245_07570 [Acidimicrobiia bacterium]
MRVRAPGLGVPGRAVLLAMGMALLAACSSGGEAGTTTSTLPSITLSTLVGSWEGGTATLQVTDDGSYQVVQDPASPDLVLMTGFVARSDDQITFVTATGRECSGQNGVYRGHVDGDVLTLTLVDDPCELRQTLFSEPFRRQGT